MFPVPRWGLGYNQWKAQRITNACSWREHCYATQEILITDRFSIMSYYIQDYQVAAVSISCMHEVMWLGLRKQFFLHIHKKRQEKIEPAKNIELEFKCPLVNHYHTSQRFKMQQQSPVSNKNIRNKSAGNKQQSRNFISKSLVAHVSCENVQWKGRNS